MPPANGSSSNDWSSEDVESTVLYAVEDGVALITLNRPEKLNATTPPMFERYLTLLKSAGEDQDVRVIVITGAGRGFCAGADRDYLREVDSNTFLSVSDDFDIQTDVAMTIDKPIIGAINGAAAGVGLAHALMTDIRFASEDASFTTAFAKLGLVAEGGLSWLLPKIVGSARALDLLYSSRTVTAAEAHEMGLVQWVFPKGEVLTEAIAYAKTLTKNSAYSHANMRRQVYGDWTRTWSECYEATLELVSKSVDRPEFREAADKK
jgi:enoyl-CoA hydratase/carnithine racemase